MNEPSPPDIPSSMQRSAGVDDRGIALPRELAETVDVFFDDQRVWSFAPESFDAGGVGSRRIPWPRLLKPALDGSTHVVLREHASEQVLFSDEHSFGAGEGRVTFTDGQGNAQVIDKWGFVQKPLSSRTPSTLAPVLDLAEDILRVLADDCGLPAWVAFGSLLGAVREGKVIAHDNDLDVAYLSSHEDPVDVAREMFRVSRALQRRGMRVLTKTGSFVTVIAKLQGGGQIPIDIYACFYVGDVLYESSSVGTPVPREAILPLGTVTLEGRELPAPADPRRLLEVSYGPRWETPDPGFGYEIPLALKQRFLGWFGSSMRNRRFWDRLYEGSFGYDISHERSPFAQWVLPQLSDGRPFLDIGCGNGRDTLWFAEQGVDAIGLDYSKGALPRCRTEAEKRGLPTTFTLLNFNDLRDTLVKGALLARETTAPRTIYGRFLLHSLEPDARRNFWQFADMMLRGRGDAFFEFRTGRSRRRRRDRPPHYSNALRAETVFHEIEQAGGRVVESHTGKGFSPYLGEDPRLCRVKVEWSR